MTECVPAHWRFYSVKIWPRNCESVKFPSLAASMTPTRIALTNRVGVNPTVKIIVFPLGNAVASLPVCCIDVSCRSDYVCSHTVWF